MKSQKPTTSLDSAGRNVPGLWRAIVPATVLTAAIGMAGAPTEAAPAPLLRRQPGIRGEFTESSSATQTPTGDGRRRLATCRPTPAGRSSPIGAGGPRTTNPPCQGGSRGFDPRFPLQPVILSPLPATVTRL